MVRTRCNILGERLPEYNVCGADQKVNPNINLDIKKNVKLKIGT